MLTKESIKKAKWDSLKSPNGWKIFKRYFLSEFPQSKIVDELSIGRKKGVIRNLVSKYTQAWEEMRYIKSRKKTIEKKDNKWQNEKTNYYSMDINFLFDYLKGEYNLTLKDIEKGVRGCMDEGDYFDEWSSHSIKELFNIFFNNPKIKKCVLENFHPDLSFPEFLWSMISSQNHTAFDQDLDEGFLSLLLMNKKIALQIMQFKRIGESIYKEKIWYEDVSQIPDKWLKEFKKYSSDKEDLLNNANKMFREYYLIFNHLFDNKKIRSMNISKDTKNQDEKNLFNLLNPPIKKEEKGTYQIKGYGKSMYPVRVKDKEELKKLKSLNKRLFDSEKEATAWIWETAYKSE